LLIGRVFAYWANFYLLGEFLLIMQIFAYWADFRLLGDCFIWAALSDLSSVEKIFGPLLSTENVSYV
jgi:hypothetical protein